MESWTILIDVVVLLGAGALLGGLFERVKQNAIVGYLFAGAILGPNVLHVVQSEKEVLAVSELGVALLLFAIGLEFSWKRLRSMGLSAVGGGALQVTLTTLVVGVGAALFGVDGGTAFTLGAVAALSSTACVLRVLASRGEIESVHGERCLGVLLVQDMAVVPLVLVVSVLAAGGDPGEVLWGVLRTAGVGVVLVATLYVVFNRLMPRLLSAQAVHGNRELPLLLAVVSGLGSAVLAHEAGVSPALGAFVAGMVLAESPFAVQVRADVSGLKTLLLTLFFTAIGMLTDPSWIARHALEVGAAVLALVIGKTLITGFALRAFRTRGVTALAAGLALAQVGEFSFVLASIARGTLFDEDTFLLVLSSALITLVLTPSLVAWAPRLTRRFGPSPAGGAEVDPDAPPVAIVVGFGPAGRATAERLAEQSCRIVVVDQNAALTRHARSLGYGDVTGDARYADVLEHAGLARASSVVITIPSTQATLEIVHLVRRHAPTAWVLVRARFHRALVELQDAGAHVVVDEEHEVGRQIARAHAELLAATASAETREDD